MNGLQRKYWNATVGVTKSSVVKLNEMYARLSAHECHWYAVAGKLFCVYYLWTYGPFVVENPVVLSILLSALIAPKVFESIAGAVGGTKTAIVGGAAAAVGGVMRRVADKAVTGIDKAVNKEEFK